MKAGKKEELLVPLPLKCLYTVPELTRATNADRRLLLRLFKDVGIRFVRVGRKSYVPLSEITAKAPEVWKSIQWSESLRQQVASGARTMDGEEPEEGDRDEDDEGWGPG